MSLSYDNNGGMIMPVSPMYGNSGMGFGGDGAWWLIVLLLIGWGGNGFGAGFGGGAGFMQSDVQRGFDQSAVMNGITGVTSAITNLGTAVNAGFANAEVANNARQIANMQQAFAAQTAVTGGMTDLAAQLAQCLKKTFRKTINVFNTNFAIGTLAW